MTDDQREQAAAIELRLRAAAADPVEDPDGIHYATMAELLILFRPTTRSTIDRWLRRGVRVDPEKPAMIIRYKNRPGGNRVARPSDVLAILDEGRIERSALDVGETPPDS